MCLITGFAVLVETFPAGRLACFVGFFSALIGFKDFTNFFDFAGFREDAIFFDIFDPSLHTQFVMTNGHALRIPLLFKHSAIDEQAQAHL